MAKKKPTLDGQKTSSPKRGGARKGSGRPTVYSLLEIMAIALRVAEVQKEHSCSRAEAIRKMQAAGELPSAGVSNLERYLTPARLNPKIDAILRESPARTGVIAAIPLPTKTRTKK